MATQGAVIQISIGHKLESRSKPLGLFSPCALYSEKRSRTCFASGRGKWRNQKQQTTLFTPWRAISPTHHSSRLPLLKVVSDLFSACLKWTTLQRERDHTRLWSKHPLRSGSTTADCNRHRKSFVNGFFFFRLEIPLVTLSRFGLDCFV